MDELPLEAEKLLPRSFILLPLMVEKQVIGILLLNSNYPNAYSNKDSNLLNTLAAYLSIALHNANAYQMVQSQHKNIQGSIQYAQTIQHAILPLQSNMDKFLNHFLIYRPRDIVSGDFYWFAVQEAGTEHETIFVAAVDCTGHGVPGAFMSLIGSTLLNETVRVKKIDHPASILEQLDEGVMKALKQDKTHNDDGMDVCLCRIERLDDGNYQILYAGAQRPLS